MFVPAVIKLSCLQRFIFSPSSDRNEWAKDLYVLGSTLESLQGAEVVGVAPDFGDWYVCLYVTFEAEEKVVTLLRSALCRNGLRPNNCAIVKKAREFGRRSGHRRVILRVDPSRATELAYSVRELAPDRRNEYSLKLAVGS